MSLSLDRSIMNRARFLSAAGGIAAAVILFALSAGMALAQETAPAAEPPAKVQELLQLLDDPAVRDWLAQHRAAATPPPAPAAETAAAPSSYFAGRVAAIRAHVTALGAALPKPGQVRIECVEDLSQLRLCERHIPVVAEGPEVPHRILEHHVLEDVLSLLPVVTGERSRAGHVRGPSSGGFGPGHVAGIDLLT